MYRSMLFKNRGKQILLVIGILIAAISTYTSGAPVVQTPLQAVNYLSNYGYLPASTGSEEMSSLIDNSGWKDAVMDFQSFNGLEITGELNNETLEFMSLPRCGLPDREEDDSDSRSKRYALSGSHWIYNMIEYQISNYPKSLNRADVDAEIARAFAVWSDYTDLKFIAQRSGPADIDIRFEEYEHGYCKPFDGPGGLLAHAASPIKGGNVHFDDGEYWTIRSYRGVNLFQVAAHEFGHSLGLSHSDVPSAVMAPIYKGFNPSFKLDSDDIAAIQELYPRSENELCRDPKIDAIFTVDGNTYVFKGEKYYKLTENAVADGYPKYISDGWPGLPSDIDAAFTYKESKTYFFKGSQYWRYSGRVKDRRYPKRISKVFPGIPDNLDAAMVWGRKYSIFFFKGKRFWRFRFGRRPQVKPTFPKPISRWEGAPNNLDAAINIGNNYIYLFKGYDFYRLKKRRSAVPLAVPKRAQSTADLWFGCGDQSASYEYDDDEYEDTVMDPSLDADYYDDEYQ